MPDTKEAATEVDERPKTAPLQFQICSSGFATEDHAVRLAQLVGQYIHELSRHIDLSQLDGVTLAFDYVQALSNLDRGYESSYQLAPSDRLVVGVAMTPNVMREGVIKSHIVLNANLIQPLENPDNENYALAFHILAHECAHVEVTHRFNTAFPCVLLQRSHPNLLDAYRWQIIMACWEEFAATYLSAGFGQDPTEGYEDTFVQSLQESRDRANTAIRAYRVHGDHARVLGEVFGAYGELMKYTSYHLGNLAGRGRSIDGMPRSSAALEGHWFSPYFRRLQAALYAIVENHGHWADLSGFELIGDLAQEIVIAGGVQVIANEDGRTRIVVPYTRATMPLG